LILFIVFLACTLPLILIFAVSITKEEYINKYGYSFFPAKISFEAYKIIFTNNSIGRSYLISIITTLVGTILAILITSAAAFVLHNKYVKARNAFAFYFFIPMVITCGLVPWYIMCTKLGLRNNLAALIVPSLIFNPFNMFITRNYMNSIPDSIMESAKIDGANDALILFRIYLPLCKPVLATIALFYGLDYWNNWFNAIMLIDDSKLYPLQYLLFKLQSEIAMLSQIQSGASTTQPPAESLKMATVIITIGPIILLYPYLQRYFVQGLVIGSIKG
jgi:putative aldouronate transport system permease protein